MRLDDACEGVFDCPHSTPSLTNEGPYVVRTQDIITGRLRCDQAAHVSEDTYRERTARVAPRFGDLLYSREGTYFGIAAEVPRGVRICLGQRMVLMRPDRVRINHSFMRYWLNSPTMAAHIHGYRDGTVAERLNLPTIRALPVLVPSLPEQKRIAHVLGALDNKIDLNRRMNATLEGISRALFKSWFVDFDPVRQKVAGKQPVGMDAQTAAIFPDSFEDSEIGEVPHRWSVVPLPEICEVNPYRPLRKGETAQYLDMANMPTAGHTPDELVTRPFGSGTRFRNGDTLVARITPCLENGKTAFIDCLGEDEVAWGSTEFIVLRPRSPLPPEYAYCLARGEGFREFAIKSMTGSSGRQRVPAESLSHFQIVHVPEELAAAFSDRVQPYFRRIRAAADESRMLASLRDALLPKLLSGEIRVPEAEQAVEEAVG